MSAIEDLENRLGIRWSALADARAFTSDLITKLETAVGDLSDPNISVVVTGSLGRGEATSDSDADWILLVDGLSNPDHAPLARTIGEQILGIVPKRPGPTGTFGEIVASHDLVHHIAGSRDSNTNLTRRILLLSESRAISGHVVRERVIRNVLARYVIYDRSVPRKDGQPNPISHFLLNDIVRYWRTMASDYASKMWERDRKEWGIRNIKLRFSRKLLFIWGLIASFSARLFPSDALNDAAGAKNEDEYLHLLADVIRQQTDTVPLELLAKVVAQADDDALGGAIFTSYDHFLGTIAKPEARKQLESVRFEDAPKGREFKDQVQHRFVKKGRSATLTNLPPRRIVNALSANHPRGEVYLRTAPEARLLGHRDRADHRPTPQHDMARVSTELHDARRRISAEQSPGARQRATLDATPQPALW